MSSEMQDCLFPNLGIFRNKAKAISAKLLDLNLKN